ncbi:MAG: hypothetical protein ACOC0P_07485 [Planctomycetota bacterium]
MTIPKPRSVWSLAMTCTFAAAWHAAGAALGQAILVPISEPERIAVLDPDTADLITLIDISDFTATPINVIDGPDGTLLLSDQVNDMVYQLDSTGALIGDYLTSRLDNIRGIHLLDCGVLGGATTNGLFGWDPTGVLLPNTIAGDFFDCLPKGKLFVGSDIDDDNVQAYDRNFVLVGQSPLGSVDFPEQINIVTENRIAAASFSDGAIYFFDFDTGIPVGSFPIRGNGGGRGVFQLSNGNFLVSDTLNGIDEYDPSGIFIRNILDDPTARYIEFCENFSL